MTGTPSHKNLMLKALGKYAPRVEPRQTKNNFLVTLDVLA